MGRIDGSVAKNNDSYAFYIIWEETDIDIEKNISKLKVYSEIYCGKHNAYDYNAYNHKLTIDGQEFITEVPGISLSPGTYVKLAIGEKIITHNDDGSKKLTISASSPNLPAGAGYGPYSGSASGEVELYKIPRASSVTCADGNIGSSTVININRASSSFTHTLEYEFLGLTGIIATKASDTSIGWNIPTFFYAKIPNALSGSGTITCKTYDGNTLIGTSTCKFNAFVINSSPTVTATVVDTNAKTIALTGDRNKIVKYYSNAKVDITATAKNSASITEKKVVAGNKNGTGTSVTLNNVETNIFNISCKDSRGLTAGTTVTKTLINYIKLAITNMVLERPEQISNTVNITLNGNYFNNTFGAVTNVLELKVRHKQEGGNFGDYTTLTATKNGNAFNYSGVLGTEFDYQRQYVFEVVVSDKLMTAIYSRTVTKGIPQIDRGKNDIKYNTYLTVNGVLEVKDWFTVSNRGKNLPTGEDTREYWNNLQNGLYWYGCTGAVPNLPEAYGFIEKIGTVGEGDFNVLFYTQKEGTVYRKSGNHESISQWVPVNSNIFATKHQVLYDNSSGTTGTVTLSENVSNFKFLEIYYQSDNQYRSIKIANPNGKIVMLSNWLYEDSSTWFYVRINKITVSGTSITRNLERSCALGSNSTIENEWSKMAITKVVGYK